MYKKSKFTISLDVLCPNLKEHKQCFERLLKRTKEEGFSSLLVHPSFQAEHNKNGKYLVYIETTNLFYATDDISGYVRRCKSNGIKPENICAINKKGEYANITF
ncbi:hypothetical protein [Lutibacter flavus]|uniref:Uncharacterized protein n=1 Tax=Lutibacter flavus TaxID=691689 RepID=A0A238VI91_9FLAO|nr:hypothetical protein [Lutibacter flavus]SNR33894.1 hypothetical protein SAMN04488111_0522 [Lutibacter flavus]